jgi:hypothetical protein
MDCGVRVVEGGICALRCNSSAVGYFSMWEIPSPQNKKRRAENNNGRQAQPNVKGGRICFESCPLTFLSSVNLGASLSFFGRRK